MGVISLSKIHLDILAYGEASIESARILRNLTGRFFSEDTESN